MRVNVCLTAAFFFFLYFFSMKTAPNRMVSMHFEIVFAGSVGLTEKKTETEPNPTQGNRTIGCSCFVWESVRLPVALFWNIQEPIKNRLQLIVTGLSTVYSVVKVAMVRPD
jgi:hypothetical protein